MPPRIGCVKYLNARPLIHGWPGHVQFDHPSSLCQLLARGDVDLALVSSFEFLRNPIYRIVDEISISSAGPVYSVIVAHRGDISEVEEIELDPAAETSVNLLRCLLAELKLNPRLVATPTSAKPDVLGSAGCQPAVAGSLPATSSDTLRSTDSKTSRQAAETDRLAAYASQTNPRHARLLIGDQAIRFRRDYPQLEFWDLGEQWKKIVDLPFVYALWLIRPEVTDAKPIADRLRALRDANLANIDKLIAQEKEFDHGFCNRYYRENLRFSFGDKEKEGLRKFQTLCEKHSLLPGRDITLTTV
jgi:chorismate dehydratase